MGAVIELFNRGGRRLATRYCDADTIIVGRAWDSDIRIDDVYVSPHHLRIEAAPSGWRVVDLDSTNGLRRRPDGARESAVTVRPGGAVWLGHTRLVLHSPDDPVAPARVLPARSMVAAMLDRPAVCAVLLAGALVLELLVHYFGSIEPFELHRQWRLLLDSTLLYGVIAASWALGARLLRQPPGLYYQMSLLLLVFWGARVVLWLWAVADYNLDAPAALQWVGHAIVALAVAVWIAAALHRASDLRLRARLAGGVGIALVYLTAVAFNWLAGLDQFRFAPRYDTALLPPSLRFVAGESPEAMRRELPAVFDRAERIVRDTTPTSPVAASHRVPASD